MNDINPYRLMAGTFREVLDDILDCRHREYWFKGGRGSTKSSFISLAIIIGMLDDPDASAIVYRRVANTIKDSVFEQLLWAIDALGQAPRFKYRVSPFEITRRDTGQRILFRGADDPMKSKSIKLKKGYFKYLWLSISDHVKPIKFMGTLSAG